MTTGARGVWLAVGFAAGCANEDKVLAELAGGWSGEISTDAGPVGAAGALEFDEETGLLTGTFALADPGQAHTYAVRRWTVSRGMVFLDLTDVMQATRGLDLDGEVGKDAFTGSATVSYPCEGGTCGYTGDFSFARGEPPPITFTFDTGPPETGVPPDTAPPDTAPPETGAPPDTGAYPDTGAR